MRIVIFAAAVALLISGTAAFAAGGQSPSTAPAVTVGSHSFGSCLHLGYELWAIPNVVNADRIVLNVNGVTGNFSFLPLAADDFNWKSITRASGTEQDGSKKMRVTFTTSLGDGRYLIYVDCGSTDEAYDFLVESINHALRLDYVPRPSSIPRQGTFRVNAVNGDGHPVSDSNLHVSMWGRWKGKSHILGVASPAGGKVIVRYVLPKSLRGTKVSLWLKSPEGAGWQAATSTKIAVRVR